MIIYIVEQYSYTQYSRTQYVLYTYKLTKLKASYLLKKKENSYTSFQE